MVYSLPGSSVHGILQARTLEWVAIPFSGNLPDPEIEPRSPALAGGFFLSSASFEGRMLCLFTTGPVLLSF